MGLLSFITGKSPEEMEIAADRYFAAREYGAAKIEYEKALSRAERKCPEKPHLIQRLREKTATVREALARQHFDTARELAGTENSAEAEDLIGLALELTGDEQLKEDIQNYLKSIRNDEEKFLSRPAYHSAAAPDGEPLAEAPDEDDHYYDVLLSTLPEEIQDAYHSYGEEFRDGYLALNQGNFGTAAERFSLALEQHPTGHLIPLELATALLHLGQTQRARKILEAFVNENPEEIRGYQMLCDIYWEQGDFSGAEALIQSCPEGLQNGLPLVLLTGETLYLQKRYEEAVDLYQQYLQNNGFNEIAARSLARTYEAMGDLDTARRIYGDIIKGCATCRTRTDPFVKQRYAELGFRSGDRSNRLLELYHTLAKEDPDNRAGYFKRIQQIYEERGENSEARRYADMIKS